MPGGRPRIHFPKNCANCGREFSPKDGDSKFCSRKCAGSSTDNIFKEFTAFELSLEKWKPIPDWPKYEASSLGRIRRLAGYDHRGYSIRGGILKPSRAKSGRGDTYKPLCIALSDGKDRYIKVKIAILVLCAFDRKPNLREVVRHLDDDQENNKLNNLEWGTQLENAHDRVLNGKTALGEKNGNRRLTEIDVKLIRNLYQPNSKDHSLSRLAKRFDVSTPTINRIILRQTWKHIQ